MPQRLARSPFNDVDQKTKLVLDDVVGQTLPYIALVLIPQTVTYRTGYSYQDPRQEHILAINMTPQQLYTAALDCQRNPCAEPNRIEKARPSPMGSQTQPPNRNIALHQHIDRGYREQSLSSG